MKLIILLLISSLTFAQSSAIIKEGEVAPFSGILLTKERAEKAAKSEKKLITMKELGEVQMQLVDFHKQEATIARKKLSEAKWDGFWSNTAYFVLGAVLTSVTLKINQKIGDI